MRGKSPGAKFDLRFTDTKTTVATDHPWRMNFTMDETTAPWDGKWHKVYLPLSLFSEGGSWDNTWYNANGLFDWKAIDRFDLVAEQGSLVGKAFWFDNIQLTNLDTAKIYEASTYTAVKQVYSHTSSVSVFPSLIHNETTIQYVLTGTEDVDISLYTLSGQKVEAIVRGKQSPGTYAHTWIRNNRIQQGVYICRVKISDEVIPFKLILI